MENLRTDNIILHGQDSIDFYNSLYHPTDEQIRQQAEYFSRLEDDVTITEQTEDGFTADIKGLDLSFLSDISVHKKQG